LFFATSLLATKTQRLEGAQRKEEREGKEERKIKKENNKED
jgi:hypothetical protein